MAEGLQKLLVFLVDRQDNYFTNNYEPAAPDYVRTLAGFGKD